MLTITHADRVAVLLLLVSLATLLAGVAGIIAVTSLELSDRASIAAIAAVIFGMYLLQERLILTVLVWRGYLCARCRSRSIVEDTRRVVRGHRCVCAP
jgi:hypothetical protein